MSLVRRSLDFSIAARSSLINLVSSAMVAVEDNAKQEQREAGLGNQPCEHASGAEEPSVEDLVSCVVVCMGGIED